MHVVRNGVSTVVQCVLQGFIHPWARGWHGRQRRPSGMHVDEVVAADVVVHARVRLGVVRRGARNVFADKGSSSLVSAAREPPDTIGTP